jgi:hypothetical protein
MTVARVTLTPQRHPSTAQWSLSIFSYSGCGGPWVQFDRDCPMEFPVNANSTNTRSFLR